MAKRKVSVAYHPGIDFLEVLFEGNSGYYDETSDDRIMVRYDRDGKVVGFAIEGVKEIRQPLDIEFSDKEPEKAG